MNKKRLIITSVISIILVSILMIGSTYSIFTSTEVDESANVYKTGVLDISYTLSSDNIILDNSTPISNDDSCKLVPYRITVTNNGNVPYMFDIILNETTASDGISSQYIGTQVGKLEPKLLSETTNNILKEDIIVPANSSVDVDVRVWISDIVQNSEIGKSFYAKLAIDGLAVYNDNEIDNSNLIADMCPDPNKPNLDNGNLIPVYYDDTNEVWKKADSSNADYSWYDYNKKKWANAIIMDSNTVTDLSNNLNNGKVVGATWDKKNKIVTTDGVDDYVDLGFENYNFGSDVTFVFRTKFSSLDSTAKYLFTNIQMGGGGFNITRNNKIEFQLHLNGAYTYCTSSFIPTINNWYTFVGTYDGANVNVYANGTSICTTPASGTVGISAAPIVLGGNPTSTSFDQYDDVIVSDALIFDRALTEAEVITDYANTPKPSNKTNLLVHYDFSDNNDIPVGTTISDSSSKGTIAFYTWIPRYKYRVWNITRQAGDESTYAYPAYSKGIDIKWESGTESTDNVDCTYNVSAVESTSNLSDTCVYNGTDTITSNSSNANYTDAWYIHPAFILGNKQLEGFWMGKFETSGTASAPIVLPDEVSLRNQTISEQFTTSKIFQTYGLSNDVDAHMLTNFEWGAVAYLTHSKYGLCTSSGCRDVYMNNSTGYYTGRSGGAIAGSDDLHLGVVYPSDSTATTHSSTTGYYNYKGYFYNYSGALTTTKDISKVASTTGNITGVYDMSGGAYEYVMANMANSSGAFNPLEAGSSWNGSSTLASKYYNAYSYGTQNTGQAAMNRTRLGDATAEVMFAHATSGAWRASMPNSYAGSNFIYNTDSQVWIQRGGYVESEAASLFAFSKNPGKAINIDSFRSSLS